MLAGQDSIEAVLTRNLVKQSVYHSDVVFLESMTTLLDTYVETQLAARFLWNHALILLRPEAMIARQSRLVLPALRAHGLFPVCVRTLHLKPVQSAAMWRYQANVMTPEHFQLLQTMLGAGPSVFLLLYDEAMRHTTPATGHVTYLKGPTLAAKRRRLHLRSIAGPSMTNLISYIHASDDPADMVRELGVLFARSERIDVAKEAAAGRDRTGDALAAIAHAELYAPRYVLPADRANAGSSRDFAMSPEDKLRRASWMQILDRAHVTRSYATGETYDTRTALIPDGKDHLAHLDDHLVFRAIGPGF